jgi:hypothetical protein
MGDEGRPTGDGRQVNGYSGQRHYCDDEHVVRRVALVEHEGLEGRGGGGRGREGEGGRGGEGRGGRREGEGREGGREGG